MNIKKQRLIAALGCGCIAAMLATNSIAQLPAGSPPAGSAAESNREPVQNREGRPGGGRPEGRPDGGPGGLMRGEPKMVAQMMLEKFDKDGDKKLDSEELVVALTEMRAQAVAGGPGGGPVGGAQMASRMFEQNDKDKDGKLTGDEIPERMRQNLARVDTNSDGAIDRPELEKMMTMMGGGPGRGPREGQPAEGDRPKRPAADE